ncbi:MAG: tetratricopeptide repeat protein [Planctomycetes bacterium]|nr:tetratricopeptide repeat protein [Planctomycetota bacterium]
MTTAGELLTAGNLDEAIQAATAEVKAKPKELEARWLLAELLILAGQHDRADAQFDALIAVEPRAAVSAIPIRHLLRAEAARRQFFDEGRVPELLDGADQQVRDRLEAFVLLRAGKATEAGRLVERAEKARPALSGRCMLGKESERGFADFRDLDDITAEVFEVLTQTGKYYWIEMRRVELIEFTPPERPLDLIWRPARMVVKDAFDAQVHLPAVYGTLTGVDAASRLGRRTDWLGEEGEAIVGVGRRSFVIDGEEEVDMMTLGSITFDV